MAVSRFSRRAGEWYWAGEWSSTVLALKVPQVNKYTFDIKD